MVKSDEDEKEMEKEGMETKDGCKRKKNIYMKNSSRQLPFVF